MGIFKLKGAKIVGIPGTYGNSGIWEVFFSKELWNNWKTWNLWNMWCFQF